MPRHVAAPAAQKPRVVQQFTTGWKFLQADATGAEKPGFDDSAWTSVTLPHDWSIAGPFKEDAPSHGAGAFAPTGVGWYRKAFTVPDADGTPTAARRTFIVFDGVMANSDVYLNGALLGHRPYGYASFVYELTPHLQPGTNTIAVRVDDSQQPASRWYPGAGINRQVRLVTTSDTHMVPWGTFVTTPEVSVAAARIHIQSTATNESAAAANLLLRVRITGPNGAPVLGGKEVSSNQPLYVSPGATGDLETEMILPRPDRWDLDHPVLYTVHATLLRDGKVVDDEDVPFGIREFYFDPNRGFFLNGVHHKVYGVALHTDAGAVGTAVPLAVWERRLTELRKLGVNAIRTAHNPPAPEFLDLADRMGFLVMDEMFDCWTVAKNPYDYHLYFKDWAVRDTTDTVMRDRNHPSIILWSAGNEIHDTPNPDDCDSDPGDPAADIPPERSDAAGNAGAVPSECQPRLRGWSGGSAGRCRAELPRTGDPGGARATARAQDYRNGEHARPQPVGCDARPSGILRAVPVERDRLPGRIADVAHVWLRVRAAVDDGAAARARIRTAELVVDHADGGHGAARGHGARGAGRSGVCECDESGPIGCGSDCSGDSGGSGCTGCGAAGAPPPDPSVRFSEPLLADWTPKDLTPHTENVEVYTNAEEVELFLNGKSLGVQRLHPDASPIVYKVPFAPGTLKAVARSMGRRWPRRS